MRRAILLATLPVILWTGPGPVARGDNEPSDGWRPLLLITDGTIAPGWVQVG